MFADSPSDFYHSADVERGQWMAERPEFSVTSRGLKFEISLKPPVLSPVGYSTEQYPLFLNCNLCDLNRPLWVFLQQYNHETFFRYYYRGFKIDKDVKKRSHEWLLQGRAAPRQAIYCKMPDGDMPHNSRELSGFVGVRRYLLL
jgi:hypothetical protein